MKIAVQLHNDLFIPRGAQRIYFGEMGCTELFKRRFQNFLEFSKQLKDSEIESYLIIPSYIREHELQDIKEKIHEIIENTDGVLCGDLGICTYFRRFTKTVFMGYVTNNQTVKFFKDILQIESFRLFPPYINILESLEMEIPAEIYAHGHIPFGGSPRCLCEMWQTCQKCGEDLLLVYEENGSAITLNGNQYFTEKEVCVMPFKERLKELNISFLVLSAFGKGRIEIEKDIKKYQNFEPYMNQNEYINGIFFCDEKNVLKSRKWDCFYKDEKNQ